MKFVLCFLVLCVISAYAFQDREFPYEYENQQEVARSPKCTPRYHECTQDRHSCCRGKLFKDQCLCFYPESNSGKDSLQEFCSCQQPWLFDKTEVIPKWPKTASVEYYCNLQTVCQRWH
uniref:U56-Deinotoxin-Dsu1d_1 n=1 Tax=Deinopis subrufa TaxID=1905329 RepID=A0A4Q8KAY6_DEISU